MARVIHFDIAAADPARACEFYSRAFGWKIHKAHGVPDYWLIRTGGGEGRGIDGGIGQREADWQRITMHVDVPSVDEAAARIVAAGGRIVQPRSAIPGVGFIVACEDTEGNVFAIIEQDETAGF